MDTPESVNVTVELSLFERPLRLEMSVPSAPTRPERMLPLFRALADAFVSVSVEAASSEGLTVSCKKGCGACCRQMVPVSEAEARRLKEMVGAMPEPRRSAVVARFDAARRRMREAGLLPRLLQTPRPAGEEYRRLGLEYFHQGVACPFLEAESCSIHEERPVVCREYLAVSPAELCSRRTAEPVVCLDVPAEVSRALQGVATCAGAEAGAWVPLIAALDWADAHPRQAPPRPGTEILRELFSRLTGADIPTPPADA